MSKTIQVINQTPMKVIAETKSDVYIFEPHYTGQNIQDLTIDEIAYIHKNTGLFKDGYLTIPDNDKETVFEEIGFKKWQEVISLDDIIDTIQNPTSERLYKILTVKSMNVFNRVHKELKGELSIPNNILNRVVDLIEYRYDELAMGKLETSIEFEETKIKTINSQKNLEKEIEELKKTIAALQKENKGTKEVETEEKPKKTRATKKE